MIAVRVTIFVCIFLIVWYAVFNVFLKEKKKVEPPASPPSDLSKAYEEASEIAKKKEEIRGVTDQAQEKVNQIKEELKK